MQTTELQVRLHQTRNGCLWSERGTGKSYGLALVAFERHRGRPVVITAPGFRQSRIVHHYLKQICEARQVDAATIDIRCVPVNQLKDVVKGMTDFLLLVDEFDLLAREYQEQIVKHNNWVGVASSD